MGLSSYTRFKDGWIYLEDPYNVRKQIVAYCTYIRESIVY